MPFMTSAALLTAGGVAAGSGAAAGAASATTAGIAAATASFTAAGTTFAGAGAAATAGTALSAAALAPVAATAAAGAGFSTSAILSGVTAGASLLSTAGKMMGGSKKGMSSLQVPAAQNLPDIAPSMDSERVLEARAKKLAENKGGREGTMLSKFDDEDKKDNDKKLGGG